MTTTKTILVPTDFSSSADAAYDQALQLAKSLGATILLAHIAEPAYYPIAPFAWESVEMEQKVHIEVEVKKVAARFAGVEVEIVQRAGTAFVELLALAEEREVDMIVMATAGRTGLEHLLIGSTAERVVRAAPCPVLTVRPGARTWKA